MAIKKLIDEGLVAAVVSTNLDGLHWKSGLTPLAELAELHGNMWNEICARCKTEQLRCHPIARTPQRLTGRHCECGGAFMDSGIDFGQCLPLRHLALAERHSKSADVRLVLGTSLRVKPSSELPCLDLAQDQADLDAAGGSGGVKKPKLAIVNRQETPKDGEAGLRSFAAVDDFMYHVMQALGLEADPPPDISRLWTVRKLTARARALQRQVAEAGAILAAAPGGDEAGLLALPRAGAWAAHLDHETGVTFFWSRSSGRVTWVHPAMGVPDEDGDFQQPSAAPYGARLIGSRGIVSCRS
jgi:NAD-dependent SIR2 family protein deacetylase